MDAVSSAILKQKFSEVYEQFFLRHNIVVSVPQVIHRGHSITKNSIRDIKIKQKLPTRMYI